jgi:hypothetical protein
LSVLGRVAGILLDTHRDADYRGFKLQALCAYL